MFIAKNQKGENISLLHLSKEKIVALKRDENFYCPDCKEKVIIRHGPHVSPHFAHQHHSQCNHQGETEIHERAKQQLYTWLKKQALNVKLEHYIAATGQIADLFVKFQNKKLAIEFQHSVIPAQDIRQRTEKYLQEKIFPLWIISEKLMPKNGRLSHFLKEMTYQFTKRHPLTLYFYCPKKKQMTLWQHLFMDKQNCYRQQYYFPLEKLRLPDLFQTYPIQTQSFYTYWLKRKQRFRLHRTSRLSKQEFAFRNWLYEKNYYIDYLPSLIYVPVKEQFAIEELLYDWQAKFVVAYFQPLKVGGEIELRSAEAEMKKNYFPLIQAGSAIEQYLFYFLLEGYVEKNREGVYIKRKALECHEKLESAVNDDMSLLNKLKKVQKLHKMSKNSLY